MHPLRYCNTNCDVSKCVIPQPHIFVEINQLIWCQWSQCPSRQTGSKLVSLCETRSVCTSIVLHHCQNKELLLVSRSFSTHWTSWAGRLSCLCDYSQRSGCGAPNLDIQMCEHQHLCNDCFSHKHSVISEQEMTRCVFFLLYKVPGTGGCRMVPLIFNQFHSPR